MGKDYFQFKQFTIRQAGAAMKVCTDSCLFGALAVHEYPSRILDIGAGTGLLTLMLAQKYPKAKFTALEPHQDSYTQAKLNIEQSPWSGNIQLQQARLQDFALKRQYKFDLIICNPPFYPAQQKNPQLNKAAHSFSLPMSEIIKASKLLLRDTGLLYVLYPPVQAEKLIKMALTADLQVAKKLYIKNRFLESYFRVAVALAIKEMDITIKTITISENANYTPEFVDLMKDYYLFL